MTGPGPESEAARASRALFAAHGRALAQLHTALSAAAFAVALAVGLALHYRKIVKNQYYGYPDEWFPSVSATVGDWFPERNLFQILIALTSGPRFLLVLVAYISHRHAHPTSSLPGTLAVVGALRTLMCGGWVFVTSSDHGDVHDVCMVAYILLNLPYMILNTSLTPSSSAPQAKLLRRVLGSSFFGALVPLVYFYLQHKQHRVAGAYSIYALVEWSLIVLDVAFDSVAILDYPDSSASPPLQLSISPVDPALFAQDGSSVFLAPATAEPQEPGVLAKAWAKVEIATAGTRHFAADIYLGFLYWTCVTALAPMIFYSAVWAMGLSGDEILLFCVISPFLLAIPPIRSLFTRPSVANLGVLIGIASVYAGDTDGEAGASEGEGILRLRLTGFGLAWATMGQVAGWWDARRDGQQLEYKTTTLLLGLVLSTVVKFANFSLNPLWPFMRASTDPKLENGGWNTFGLSVGVIAYLDSVMRRARATPPTPPAAKAENSEADRSRPTWLGTVGSVIGFSSSFFLVHWLFTDSGTIIAWSFEGYPATGPFAFPHGLLTISALSLGVVLSNLHYSMRIASSIAAYATACVSAALLYSQTYWAAFFPGCLLGVYAVSTFPAFVSSILFHSPTRPAFTFGTAFFLYVVLQLASTWPVAYAFVPAGWLLRERTDIVLGIVVAGVGIGVLALPAAQKLALAAGSRSQQDVVLVRSSRGLTRRVNGSILFLLLTGTLVLLYRAPGYFAPGVPYKAQERVVTAAIWTVHFGLDGRMWESQRRMAEFMRDAEVDIIGLLETDNHRIVGGNRELTQWMAHSLNMPYTDLGPGPHKNTWGCVLISKYPILRSSHHLLPSPAGELAPAIHATLDVYGTEVDIVVAHNGQEEDPLDRELQSRELGRIMRERWPTPTIFLGYLVTHPHAERPAPYKLVTEDASMLDIAPQDNDRWCQYILYRGLHRVAYARLNRGSDPSVTDSEVQLGKFVVPLIGAEGSSYTTKAEAALVAIRSSPDYNASDPNSLRVPPIPLDEYVSHLQSTPAPIGTESDQTTWTPERYMPEALHFPKSFYGHGVNGHRYIVLTGQAGEEAPNYFMNEREKEWRRLQELDDLAQEANGCPVQ